MNRWSFYLAAVLTAALAPGCMAATLPSPATIAGSEVLPIDSSINGAHYKLTVILPPDYARAPDKHYPVLYVMDGDAMSLLAAYALPRLENTDEVPQMIVVGVDYPGATERGSDYGPLSQTYWKMPANRGAEKFIRVLKEEIIPLIDGRYRTDPSNRGIGGHSLGGLISGYALVHASDTFNHFWISSGSLFWDNDVVLHEIADFTANHPDPHARVFADVGGDEAAIMQGSIQRLQQSFLGAGWGQSAFHLSILQGEVHPTVPSTVFADAMTFLYGTYPAGIMVPRARIEQLSGNYRASGGKSFALRNDGKDLYIDGYATEGPPLLLMKLDAASSDLFQSRSAGVRIKVIDQPGGQPRLHISVNGEDPPETDAERVP